MKTAADGCPAGALAIRSATAADVEALSEFAAHVFYETFAPDNDPTDMREYLRDAFTPEKQAAEMADPSTVCLLAAIDHAIVGYALMHVNATDPMVPGTRSVELQRFYVDHAWHGRGIASPLMAACIDTARTRDGATLWLGVWERNARAIRFYVKHGFTDVGSQKFRLGRDLQTDRVMSRPVAASADVSV